MRHTLKISIPKQEVASQIVIQRGIHCNYLWEKMAVCRFAIITDHTVKRLYGLNVQKNIQQIGGEVHLVSVPPGEQTKSRKWKEAIEDELLDAGLGRDAILIALGGGVITDLAGFVAATYCRGIPWISLPTSLLGQVDASIGGKVGINTKYGKNLLGAFYHPSLILIDPETLSTLPKQEKRNGMAEVIKYALIASRELFEKLTQLSYSFSDSPLTSWEEVIVTCCEIKKMVVETDPQEKSMRRILNFGHTIGHALEAVMDYQISHGEAVALGMVAEAHLSHRLGYLSEIEFSLIYQILEKYGFSLTFPRGIKIDQLMEKMHLDKKSQGQIPRFVLLQTIGKTMSFEDAYCTSIKPEMIKETLQWLI